MPTLFRPDCIAIGSSTGGPQALFKVFQMMGKVTNLPVFVTQHMPATFTTILAEHLGQASGMPAAEAKDGEPVTPGRIYVAPGDFHMTVTVEGGRKVMHLDKNPPENFCRPAVDPMLRSLAKAYNGKVLTVILTGMGQDGLKGGQETVGRRWRHCRAGRGDQRRMGHAGRCRQRRPVQRRVAAFRYRALCAQGHFEDGCMTVTDFEFICQILRERSGLVLTNDKAYLLESRLLPVARKWKLATFDDLVRVIRSKMDEAVVRDVVEAMTTNESFFFRDTKPFDQFKALVLPALLKSRAASRTIRIWSAACSSGQEPYSLAMILSESAAQLNGWKIEIVGTDLSTEILNRAKEGMYSQFEVQRGLPITMLVKYFSQIGDRWQINAKIRGMVQYKEFNLLTDPMALGRFDVVFCRNVLIYFDQPTKTRVLNSVSKLMPEDGFLFLGGAETVLGITDKFQMVPGQRGVYGVASASASGARQPMPSFPIAAAAGAPR